MRKYRSKVPLPIYTHGLYKVCLSQLVVHEYTYETIHRNQARAHGQHTRMSQKIQGTIQLRKISGHI